MNEIKVGCQTITWGDGKNKDETLEVLREASAAGYQGVEIGCRHLDLAKPHYYKERLQELGLSLVALHIGGNFLVPESVAKDRSEIDAVLDFLQVMGSEFVAISGRERYELDEFRSEAADLARLGAACRDRGIKLCYHNHHWEIKNGALGLRTIRDNTDPGDLHFALDVGWVKRAGGQPVELLQEFIDRVGYVHLKDTKDDDWTEVGYGTVDVRGVAGVLRGTDKDWWAVTEQDSTKRTPAESVKMSRDYLKNVCGI